ncbi:MAG: hypothetical protein AAF487_14865, partial [Bacteroidota bacterium]
MGDEDIIVLAITSIFILLFIGLLIARIVFFSHLEQLFNKIEFEHRTMPAGQVWLLLIPCFGPIWLFIVIDKLSDSLSREF